MDRATYIKKRDKLRKEMAKKLLPIVEEFIESNRQFDIGDIVQSKIESDKKGVVSEYVTKYGDYDDVPELLYTCKYLDSNKHFDCWEYRLKLIEKCNNQKETK